ncbi:hypothetical protein N0V93_005322 [Gnomoniopsis smithogilvyi]|uniref:Calpain catalytic domain-containing protein n=1 Tax=Gnomoniopsis smithogilvyi TaxID=1191159 RepID=A0A9W8YSN6_9PEZI|nr:hypothetical protein N0V93_005322 [Gnomoniopsis smithogilvyi]
MGRKHVYNHASSDSDSEDSSVSTPSVRRHRRRQHDSHKATPQIAAPTPQSSSDGTAEDKKKKKKKKAQKPPQESIDSIWEKFSQKKFSKALAVLPFSPVQASTSGERGNEPILAGYERAAEECRRKVRKIISECKRVNTRYRDPGWDLDWDFKWGKGHTLNSLMNTKFDISRSNLVNPGANIPKAVKRVHEIFEKPTFMESVLPGDIKQGNLGNCWFVASLTGLANVPDGLKRICVEYDTSIYGFVFYRDGEWIYSIIDDKLFLKSPCWDSPSMQRNLLQQIDREDVERVYRETYQTGSQALFFAQNKDQNETWVPLIEKAYAKAHGDFASLAGGWIGEALEDLSGGVTTELLASDIFDTDAFWENELSKVNEEFLFGCSTGLLDGGYGARDGITEGHAYVIMDARLLKDGTRLCKLRNPWGKIKKGNWEGAWSDGSKEWTHEAQKELNHTFGSDSTFWISYEDLLRKYLHFDRTRLFRDADWRSCQRWIGVEVPWKPQYNEKFHIKLTKESPVVLVLSQLDHRYFRGLQGQYNFRLQFRLHEEGKTGAEEYIVRSHGNYLMDRSVSIELPNLSPGNYLVYISIIGERNTRLPSTEDVVKRECEGREENEKLAQVGQAYDLAHSKAASHLDQLFKVRKKADAKKASEARKKERRKNWEKRQTGRGIAQKQKEKDEAKKAEGKRCKRAKAEAKAKAEAEAKQAAEKAAEEQTKQAQPQPIDKAIGTNVRHLGVGGSHNDADADSVSTAPSMSSSTGTPQYTPQDSPRSQAANPAEITKEKVDMPPAEQHSKSLVSGGPPTIPAPVPTSVPSIQIDGQKSLELKLHYCSCSTCKPPPKVDESDGYSSDSPVEDYEQLYDEDDANPTLRLAGSPAPAAAADEDSEDENTPDPWNAIAVVGFRVFSKDADLELRVIMEGGELEQAGMGNLGEADLDNAVTNAAGQREKKQDDTKKELEGEKGESETTKSSNLEGPEMKTAGSNADSRNGGAISTGQQGQGAPAEFGKALYRTIIERQTSEFDRVMGKLKPAPVNKVSATADNAVDKATIMGDITPTTSQSHAEVPVTPEKAADQDNQGDPAAIVRTNLSSSEPHVEEITKAILLIRSKLQNGCRKMLMQDQSPSNDDLQEMSNSLAKLEAFPDLEASVIQSTRIHKVMMAILKLERLPEDDGFKVSIGSRARALLDDYELTLMSAGDSPKSILAGL